MMSSHQISSLASGQAAMFGQFTSYAQQITPQYARPAMGYTTGAPPAPPPMPAWSPHTPPYSGGLASMGAHMMTPGGPGSNLPGVFGERLLGGGLGALATGTSVAGTALGVAPLLGMGASALGIGGGMAAGLGMMGGFAGLPAMAGVAAAGWGANQMMSGFQQRQAVNRVMRTRFGGAYGVGSGRGGRGFSTGEMGEVSTMIREMGAEDLTESTESLTRIMDRTASMGLYRGVQSAKQFRQRFQQLTSTLKEIAQTMNTTLEGATEFMSQSRQMGFFSGQDISRNLIQSRLGAASTGMSVQQIQQIGQMGSQMGMAMGMRGRTGAGAAINLATDIGTAVRTGALRSESLFEATGGLTGAEGVQALTGSIMQANQRFLSRGAGRLLTAAAWDPTTGGINQDVLGQIQRGEISFQEARSMGRRNISSTGGRRSEFFAQEERIRGQLQEQGGMELGISMLESHLQRRGRGESFDDPIAQRFLRRQMGYSQAEVESIQEMRRQMPVIMRERRQAASQEVSNMMQTRRREGAGIQGMRRRWAQWWERDIQNPIKQVADDLTTRISEGVEGLVSDFEGRIQTSISAQTKSMVSEWAATGVRPAGISSFQESSAAMQRYVRVGAEVEGTSARGFVGSLGRLVGARGPTMEERLRRAKASDYGLRANATTEERIDFLNKMQRDLSVSASELGVSSQEMRDLGTRAFDAVTSSMSNAERDSWRANRSNSEKAYQMAEQRIAFLRETSPEAAAYFDKAGPGYKSIAALSLLERAGKLGVLGIDTSAFEGGGGSDRTRLGLIGLRAEHEKGLDRLVAMSGTEEDKKRARAGIGEIATRSLVGIATLGVSEVMSEGWGRLLTGKSVFKRAFGRFDVSGSGIDRDAAGRLLENEEIQADVIAARSGDKGALRRLQQNALEEGTGQGTEGTYGLNERDRRELGELTNMVAKGTEEQKEQIDQLMQGASDKRTILLTTAIRKDAEAQRRFIESKRSQLEEGMGEEALAAYDEIISMHTEGDLDSAFAAEKAFYEQWGGKPEGAFLLANLRKEGIGGGIAEGLSTMADYTRLFRGDARKKAKTLLQMTLGQAGITGQRDLNRLLSPSFLRRVHAGEVSPEELSQELTSKMTDEDRTALAERGMTTEDLAKDLRERIAVGKGGVTGEELRETLAGEGTGAAMNARISGASEEDYGPEAKSLKEIQTTNALLKMMLAKQGVGEREIADALKNLSKEGGGDAVSPTN